MGRFFSWWCCLWCFVVFWWWDSDCVWGGRAFGGVLAGAWHWHGWAIVLALDLVCGFCICGVIGIDCLFVCMYVCMYAYV